MTHQTFLADTLLTLKLGTVQDSGGLNLHKLMFLVASLLIQFLSGWQEMQCVVRKVFPSSGMSSALTDDDVSPQ